MVYVESCCTHITSDKTQINVKSKKFWTRFAKLYVIARKGLEFPIS